MSTAIEPKTSHRPPAFRWSVAAYERVAETGVFDGRRVELIDGEIVSMSPRDAPRVIGVEMGLEALRSIFPRREYWTRCRMPLMIAPHGAPEPDLAVVNGAARTHPRRGHPTTAPLVVEVSESSLGLDRAVKAVLYAQAGVPDDWIVNLVDRVVEVRRRPERRDDGSFGYAETTVAREGESVSPLARPEGVVPVAELFR